MAQLLDGMTPALVRLDLQTAAFDSCKAALEAAVPGGVKADTEPWFNIPYLELQLPAELLQRWGWEPAVLDRAAGRSWLEVAAGGWSHSCCRAAWLCALQVAGVSGTVWESCQQLQQGQSPIAASCCAPPCQEACFVCQPTLLRPAATCCCSWKTAAPSPDLTLPPQNTYLPSDFTLVGEEEGGPAGAQGNGAADKEMVDAPGGPTAAAGAVVAAAAAGTDTKDAEAGKEEHANGVEALLPPDDAAAFPSPPDLILDEPGLR